MRRASRDGRRGGRAADRGRGADQALPDHQRHPARARGRQRCARSTASTSRSRAAETLGLVGESGCGKSTTGRMLVRLIEPTAGTIRVAGESLSEAGPERLRALRREMQIIFQDPFGSLNPRMTVRDIIAEPLVVHGSGTPRRAEPRRVRELLEVVGLASSPRRALPARVLGRPAPAHRHRPRARARTPSSSSRRAGLGARRLDPGADHQPDAGPAGRVRADLPLHLARPRRGEAHRRPRRGDVPRPDRRDRRQAAPLRQPRGTPTPRA